MTTTDPTKASLYIDNFLKLGDTPQAVHYGSAASANIRYQSIIDTVGDLTGLSVLDIGCGLGHLYEYVRKQKQLPLAWVGVEMEESFVRALQEKFKFHPKFQVLPGQFLDLLQHPAPHSLESDPLSAHFHLAILLGPMGSVNPKDMPMWVEALERDCDVDCFVIEFLRAGVNQGPFHKYDIHEVRSFFENKEYEYKFVFNEIPHIFTVYAWPHKPRKRD